MAFLRLSHSLPQTQTQLTLGFSSTPKFLSITPFNFSPSSTTFRCKGSTRLQVNQRLLTVYATNPNSVGGKSPKEGSDVGETNNVAQGPPLLTILAGLFIFFAICWLIGSIIMWLISLIVTAPPPK